MKIRMIISLLFIIFLQKTSYAESLKDGLVHKMRNGVVSITNILISPIYLQNSIKEIYGTGFIADKKRGLIVTNEHIVTKKRISEYNVTFSNGREVRAKLLYADPSVDFAVLKVDAEKMPSEAEEIKLSNSVVKVAEKVFIIGNNQGNDYSMQDGIISSVYDSRGMFPSQDMVISLNTKGGSSGSPIINKKGEVVGLNYASDGTYASAIQISYIIDALKYLREGKIPPRKDPGVRLRYYSLDRAVTFSNLPSKLVEEYGKKYKTAFNRALRINFLPEGSAARNVLMPGDIIWSVNGVEIGPNLYEYHKLCNNAQTNSIPMEVYRDGKLLKIDVPLTDLTAIDTSKVIMFGGGVFSETGHYLNFITGIPVGRVSLTNIITGSSFDVIPWMNITNYGILYSTELISIDGVAINSIDDLIKQIPKVLKKKNFKSVFRNYGYIQGFNNVPNFNHGEFEVEIEYNLSSSEPTLMYYDEGALKWQMKKICEFSRMREQTQLQ